MFSIDDDDNKITTKKNIEKRRTILLEKTYCDVIQLAKKKQFSSTNGNKTTKQVRIQFIIIQVQKFWPKKNDCALIF